MILSHSNRKQRGGALISALIAIVVMATMAIGLSSLTMTSNGMIVDTEDRQHALMLAESGLAIAFRTIDANTFDNDLLVPVGTVIYTGTMGEDRFIEVTKTKVNGRAALFSTGIVDKKLILGNVTQAVRKVEGIIGIQSMSGAFPAGAFGLSNLVVGGNFASDSYSSLDASGNLQPYGGTNVSNMGDIGTNGTLTVNGSSLAVDGAAHPGPGQPALTGSTPVYDAAGNLVSGISGDKSPLASPVKIAIPPYSVPTTVYATSLPGGPNKEIGAIGSTQVYHLTEFNIGANEQITIKGTVNMYVDSNIDIKGDLFMVNNDAKLNVYHNSGTITLNGGGASNSYTAVQIDPDPYTIPAGGETTEAVSVYVPYSSSQQSPPTYASNQTVEVDKHGNTIDGWTITIPANTTLSAAVTYNPPPYNEPGGGIADHFNIISQTSDLVKVNGTATLFATIVAPNAPVKLNGDADKFGAILGKTMTLLGTGEFHWDLSARSPGISRVASLISYREVP
jgi:hypothetical protein